MSAIDIQLKDFSKEVMAATTHQIAAALIELGETAEGYAKLKITENGNVDTGRLRNSIAHRVDMGAKCVYIGSNVEYAPYIEFGTGLYAEGGGRQTPWIYTNRKGETVLTHGSYPHPFLRPAISEHVNEYNDIIKKHLSK